MRHAVVFTAMLFLVPTASCKSAGSIVRATIEIDAAHTVGAVNRRVFGNNLVDYQSGSYGDASPDSTNLGQGVWDAATGKPDPLFLATAKEAGITVARWPGGCATHLYQWKRTIGPLSSRPDQLFGLPEYLEFCRQIGAEPLISVAEYEGLAQDAADLVEYLNAPADPAHPWAMKRASDGHQAPWAVKWFEFGNESDHGPHPLPPGDPRKAYTPAEYVAKYLQYREAMRKCDPSIRLGAVVTIGVSQLAGWPTEVAHGIGKSMDFAIFHCYLPSLSNPGYDPKRIFVNGFAGGDQIQDFLDRLKVMLQDATGRKHTPIAVTEYNGGFVQEQPVPYRYTLGEALIDAEMLRVWLRPDNDILMANFWEFPNEYWGMVKGFPQHGAEVVRRPTFYPSALYASHFGAQMLDVKVACPGYDTPGDQTIGIEAHQSEGKRAAVVGPTIHLQPAWKISETSSARQRLEGSTVQVDFDGTTDLNYFHAMLSCPAEGNAWYRVDAYVRTKNLTTNNGACFQISDDRGWPVTHSAAITSVVTGTADWTKVSGVYQTLPDTHGIQVIARRISGAGAVSGSAWYRDVSVTRIQPHVFPAVPLLGVTASISDDRKTVYLMVTNRSLDESVEAEITAKGVSLRAARAWVLTGPSAASTNETDPHAVGVKEVPCKPGSFLFPPHSLTALELRS